MEDWEDSLTPVMVDWPTTKLLLLDSLLQERMYISVPAISMDHSVWMEDWEDNLTPVTVDWPKLLQSREREGLQTWLYTRKAESDRKEGEKEDKDNQQQQQQEEEMEQEGCRDATGMWVFPGQDTTATGLGSRLPLPLTESLAPFPPQGTNKDSGTLDELKEGLLAAWAGGAKEVVPEEATQEAFNNPLKCWLDNQEDSVSNPEPVPEEGTQEGINNPLKCWLDSQEEPVTESAHNVLPSLWKPSEKEDELDNDEKDLVGDLKKSLLGAWKGTVDDDHSKTADDKKKDGEKEPSIAEDLKMFLLGMSMAEDDDQTWISVDEDDASIVTLEDIEDIDEMAQWLCNLS